MLSSAISFQENPPSFPLHSGPRTHIHIIFMTANITIFTLTDTDLSLLTLLKAPRTLNRVETVTHFSYSGSSHFHLNSQAPAAPPLSPAPLHYNTLKPSCHPSVAPHYLNSCSHLHSFVSFKHYPGLSHQLQECLRSATRAISSA